MLKNKEYPAWLYNPLYDQVFFDKNAFLVQYTEKSKLNFSPFKKIRMDISMVNQMIDFVNAKLKLFVDSPLNPDKKQSGYLSCTDRKSGNCIFILPVGDVPAAKQKKYQMFAMEKGSRVYKLDTFTSYETRDESTNKWGGGISTLKYILAFSGLPELADEALMVSLAHHMEMPTEHTSELKTLDAYRKHLIEEKRTNEYLEFFIAA